MLLSCKAKTGRVLQEDSHCLKGTMVAMNIHGPLVSVVMPNYNTPEEYLRQSIESILSQTYENFELIIVDDASTGLDVDVIKSYADERIIFIQNESNRHISYTLNRGLKMARGKYIARMDSDDYSIPRRIEKQVAFLENRPDIDVLCAKAAFFGDKRGIYATGIRNAEQMKAAVFFGCPIIHPSVMFRTSFLKAHGIFYNIGLEYKAAEDYELWARCVSIGQMCEYPSVLLRYRMHAKQVSSVALDLQIESANHVRRILLAHLGIEPDVQDMRIHFNYCVGNSLPDISLDETEKWVQGLLLGNEKHQAFNPHCFKKSVFQHYLVVAIKSFLQKRATIGQLLQSRLFIKTLCPAYYPEYIKRFMFSKRLNRSL